ncbi:MAG: chemotaxis response regulator protein-glutamate methylesterase [Selenomonadaceae bacterium]|nr:chemotaxis response regulator protein-glutamate methylesterase [Selenomonadaceae bacterium]
MIRVVVADDSAFMRKVLSDLFEKTPGFQVVGTARDGREAVKLVAKERPDLLTLDINMPVMDGLSALEIIMKDCPVPVLMFSSLTRKGADETLRALELGAVDFLCKTGGSISKIDAIEADIIDKCRSVAGAKINKSKINKNIFAKKQEAGNLKRINIFERKGYNVAQPQTPASIKPKSAQEKLASSVQQHKQGLTSMLAKRENPLLKKKAAPVYAGSSSGSGTKLVALGTSTGGPRALQQVIPKLPGSMPCGMVVVQHMPAGFTKSLADRLNSMSQVTVKEAEDGEPILPGHVYIAPGGYHLTVAGNASNRAISLNQDPPLASHRPAVDIMFDSVVKYGGDIVSVILTGMGCDGAAGMKKIKRAGGYVIAESDETCVVYGMPKSVVEAGIADEVLPVGQIADAIMKKVRN